MITIVAKWTQCGQSELEQFIEELTEGNIISIEGYVVQELLTDRTEYVQEQYPSAPFESNEAIWPTRHYWLYYAYHPHSAKYTEFEIGSDSEGSYIRPVVKEHPGGRFPAFWSEVIIFRID